jgi:hypothetical protein
MLDFDKNSVKERVKKWDEIRANNPAPSNEDIMLSKVDATPIKNNSLEKGEKEVSPDGDGTSLEVTSPEEEEQTSKELTKEGKEKGNTEDGEEENDEVRGKEYENRLLNLKKLDDQVAVRTRENFRTEKEKVPIAPDLEARKQPTYKESLAKKNPSNATKLQSLFRGFKARKEIAAAKKETAEKKVQEISLLFEELKKKPLEEIAQKREQLQSMGANLEKIKKDLSIEKVEELINQINELNNKAYENQLKFTTEILNMLGSSESSQKAINMPMLHKKKEYFEKILASKNNSDEEKDQANGFIQRINELTINTHEDLAKSKEQHEKNTIKKGGLKAFETVFGNKELEKEGLDTSKNIEERIRLAKKGVRTEAQYLFENREQLAQTLEKIISHDAFRNPSTKNKVEFAVMLLDIWINENPLPPRTEKHSLEEEIGWYQDKIEPIRKMLVDEIDIDQKETVYDKDKIKEKESGKYYKLAGLVLDRIEKVRKPSENIPKVVSAKKGAAEKELATAGIKEEIVKVTEHKGNVAEELMIAVQKDFKYDTLTKAKVATSISKFFRQRQHSAEKDPMKKVAEESVRGWDVAKKLIGPGVGDNFPLEQKKKFTHIALDHIDKHLKKADDYVNEEVKLSKEEPKEKWMPFKKDLEPLGGIRLGLEKGGYYTGKQKEDEGNKKTT